jgi:hypothetical protein
MVDGLDKFANHFEAFTENYVLIGGTACDLAMQLVGQSFRATKDLDIVLFLDQRRELPGRRTPSTDTDVGGNLEPVSHLDGPRLRDLDSRVANGRQQSRFCTFRALDPIKSTRLVGSAKTKSGRWASR